MPLSILTSTLTTSYWSSSLFSSGRSEKSSRRSDVSWSTTLSSETTWKQELKGGKKKS